ncbi:cellulase family glycosylhydrolase [Christiangramia aquimixticola]|uniref:cellulase family glycosylhydrolase n=1 Tax=Christiangramia aquimixticola TaxID=1697558 RepID=UPI003AA80922
MRFNLKFSLLLMALVFLVPDLMSQDVQQSDVYVDGDGIMRWGHNDMEVHGFGVNYSAPFAHAFRSAKKRGLDIKKEIDRDIYHFTRLGFDLYRLHVWDTEISDEKGNLIQNENLETFDYLIQQLKERDINFVITPIAYWGNGWPEPDEDTPGFSNKYGKENSLTNPEAIKAQQNYLTQFMEHVNPFTGVAYKNEPNIIAIEVSNEPHHRGTPKEVKRFINKMVAAIRKTGTKKPVFYNVSHSIQLAETYFDSNIQGGTFQWYPTGLGFQQELEGNLLPNVNDYDIPFEEVIKKNNAAKLVYEFDAADVNKAYMYPAMARSFREAGIQIATHFAYDPTFLAYANTEYNTHYMNLNYIPHKALALMIASEIFHNVELGEDQGVYPENLEFGDFKIAYEGDIATYNSGKKFIYTNTNSIEPKSPGTIEEIAGHGNSRLVAYNGKGAYFLDKLENGVWRLEVMPDPILIDNPFGANSLDKTVAVIKWAENKMNIDLKDLGGNFQIIGLNEGNQNTAEATEGSFPVRPGAYLLTAPNKEVDIQNLSNKLGVDLRGFEAQTETVDKTYLVHKPVTALTAGNNIELNATLVSNENIEKVEVWFQNANTYNSVELMASGNYDYSAQVPQELLTEGILKYRIIVTTSNGKFTFPEGVQGSPDDWDFHSSETFSIRIYSENSPIYLFSASKDSDKVVRSWSPGNKIIPVNDTEDEFQIHLEQLFTKDPENLNARPVYDYSFRYNFADKTKGIDFSDKKKLVLKARNLQNETGKLQVALVMKNGASFGKVVELTPEIKEIEIKIEDLLPVKTVTLPRPYPGFLPYYFEHSYNGALDLDLNQVESVQFSIGPGIEQEKLQQSHSIGIRSLRLE